jgi:hypothetical protein
VTAAALSIAVSPGPGNVLPARGAKPGAAAPGTGSGEAAPGFQDVLASTQAAAQPAGSPVESAPASGETAPGFQPLPTAPQAMAQSAALPAGAGLAADETTPAGAAARKPGAPRRAGKDKEAEQGKQLLDALAAVPLAAEAPRRAAIVLDTVERRNLTAGAAGGEAGPPAEAQAAAGPNPTPADAPATARSGLAFAGRLVMAVPETGSLAGSKPRLVPNSPAAASPDAQGAADAPEPVSRDAPREGGGGDEKARHGRTAEPEAALRAGRASAEDAAAPRAADGAPRTPPIEAAATAAGSGRAAVEPGKPAAGAAAPPPEPAPANPAAHGPARQIALELNRGDARVDVKLVERGGELTVSVRTPDARLAGDLRSELPSLAARLEQTGLHAASWQTESGFGRQQERGFHPQTQDQSAGGGERRDSRRDDRQQEQGGPAPLEKTQNRKEFAWFMTSLG